MSRMLNNPLDLAAMRIRLFNLPEEIILSPEQFDTYWPYMTNVWIRNKTPNPRTNDGRECSYWWCRQHATKQRTTNGSGDRASTLRKVTGCPMKLKMIAHYTSPSDKTPAHYSIQKHAGIEHNHDLDASDAIKRNRKLKEIVADQIAHGYNGSQVRDAIKPMNCPEAEQALIDAGGAHLKRYDIYNAGLGLKKANPHPQSVCERHSVQDEWSDLADWIESAGYLCQNITARQQDNEVTYGTVFASQASIDVLRMRGYLTLMDSTNDTNRLGWFLYTMAVRDETGSWRPCAHLLAKTEDGDLLAAAFTVIKTWCGGREGWKVRYMLTDNSAAEQRAVSIAFPGFIAGETEVTHLLCVLHSEQTLKRRFNGPRLKKTHRHLRSALRYRRNVFGVEDSIRLASEAAPSDDVRRYIEKEWWKTREQWAMAYRLHSPLLIQIDTTSPIEGYHSSLKTKEGKDVLRRSSLTEIAKYCLAIDKEWDQRAADRATKFRTRILPQVADYPFLYRLPTPVQQLMAEQIKLADHALEASDDIRELDDEVRCDCQFFRKYQLPCKDIWYQHRLFNTLTEEDFDRFSFMWEDSGYELYETITSEYFERAINQDIGAPARRRLDMREALDSVKSRHFELESQVAHMDSEEADKVMRWWIDKLERITGPLRSIGIADLQNEIQQNNRIEEEPIEIE